MGCNTMFPSWGNARTLGDRRWSLDRTCLLVSILCVCTVCERPRICYQKSTATFSSYAWKRCSWLMYYVLIHVPSENWSHCLFYSNHTTDSFFIGIMTLNSTYQMTVAGNWYHLRFSSIWCWFLKISSIWCRFLKIWSICRWCTE
jgi:hypothetical protein